MVWPHLKILRHGENNFVGDSEIVKDEKKTVVRRYGKNK